jgi:secreted PhoX family phosphatase
MTYELIELENGTKIVKRFNDNDTISWIPVNEANSDYQRYLNPEAEQSTPSV